MKSFMTQELYNKLFFDCKYIEESFAVQTAHQKACHKGTVVTPFWKEVFGENDDEMRFYVINFSNNCNVLLGIDIC